MLGDEMALLSGAPSLSLSLSLSQSTCLYCAFRTHCLWWYIRREILVFFLNPKEEEKKKNLREEPDVCMECGSDLDVVVVRLMIFKKNLGSTAFVL